jgi:hypothetical protein
MHTTHEAGDTLPLGCYGAGAATCNKANTRLFNLFDAVPLLTVELMLKVLLPKALITIYPERGMCKTESGIS